MNIKETINIIDYAIKYYRDKEFDRKFSLLEYYSITDISPKDLAKIAYKEKMIPQGAAIISFNDLQCWSLKEVDVSTKLKDFHSFNGVELTSDDKLAIVDKINYEGYPLIEGIYDRTAFYYANNQEFTKESIREKIMNKYNNCSHSRKAKVLKK